MSILRYIKIPNTNPTFQFCLQFVAGIRSMLWLFIAIVFYNFSVGTEVDYPDGILNYLSEYNLEFKKDQFI